MKKHVCKLKRVPSPYEGLHTVKQEILKERGFWDSDEIRKITYCDGSIEIYTSTSD